MARLLSVLVLAVVLSGCFLKHDPYAVTPHNMGGRVVMISDYELEYNAYGTTSTTYCDRVGSSLHCKTY